MQMAKKAVAIPLRSPPVQLPKYSPDITTVSETDTPEERLTARMKAYEKSWVTKCAEAGFSPKQVSLLHATYFRLGEQFDPRYAAATEEADAIRSCPAKPRDPSVYHVGTNLGGEPEKESKLHVWTSVRAQSQN